MIFETEFLSLSNSFIGPFLKFTNKKLWRRPSVRYGKNLQRWKKSEDIKRRSADFSFSIFDVWGEAFESWRGIFRPKIGLNFIQKAKIW